MIYLIASKEQSSVVFLFFFIISDFKAQPAQSSHTDLGLVVTLRTTVTSV